MADGSDNSGEWTRERIDLVKRVICPKGITDDEFALFMEQCKRSGLDPLMKQAFCVPRRQNIGDRERPNWVTKHEFQASRDGLLVRANQFPDYRGMTSSAAYAEDDLMVDAEAGNVSHKYNPAKRKGSLVGAWARVVRDGKLPNVVWVDFAAYVQQTPLWSKMPATMIQKVAEAAALRKAYPAEFGGLYIAGERPDDREQEDESGPVVDAEPQMRAPAQPVLPAVSATREATPTMEFTPASEKVPVTVDAQPAPAAPQSSREPGQDDGEELGEDAKLWALMEEAQDEKQLRAVGAKVKEAHEAGRITDEERKRLGEEYATHQKRLRKEGAK